MVYFNNLNRAVPLNENDTFFLYAAVCLTVRFTIGLIIILCADLVDVGIAIFVTTFLISILNFIVFDKRKTQPWWWENNWRRFYRIAYPLLLSMLSFSAIVSNGDTRKRLNYSIGGFIWLDILYGGIQNLKRYFKI